MTIATAHDHSSSTDAERDSRLRHTVAHAAHYLPAQGPIEVFVHHNTLHAFEEMPFHEAVAAGLRRFGAQPYWPEATYRRLLEEGRVTGADLKAVLREEAGADSDELIDGLGTVVDIRLAMLQHPLHVGPDAELKWVIAETDALTRFRPQTSESARRRLLEGLDTWLQDASEDTEPWSTELLEDLRIRFGSQHKKWNARAKEAAALQLLWRTCRHRMAAMSDQGEQSPHYQHPRFALQKGTGEDINRYVHDVLIRFCGAFLDQGYADWALPDRDKGLFRAFLALYSRPGGTPDAWMSRLRDDLKRIQREQLSPEDVIEEVLTDFQVADADRDEFILQSLLSLPGWAGMVWQMESAAEWTVRPAPKGSLLEYLAVQLILDRQAVMYVGRTVFGEELSVAATIDRARTRFEENAPLTTERRAFLLFQVAQMRGWSPVQLRQLEPEQWQRLVHEVEAFDGLQRRRIFHEAYERRYRTAALDAFAAHSRRRREYLNQNPPQRPAFQIVCCIDDREESFRRHLEEVVPECETFGAAGFFAVAMKYKGAADAFFKPLCPAVIDPDHYVVEDVGYSFEGVHRSRAQRRSQLGKAAYTFHTRSRTFLGGIFAGIVGSLATAPLVARVLFPRLTARIRSRFGRLLQPPPVTQLQLQRYKEPPGPHNGHVGFTLPEMADIVERLLRDIGLTQTEHFSRLFIVCGHGSSSLNNPHESAYCCGACAGKRGGPNARAFAQMANDWRVRMLVAERGINIPDDTFFVGAYHNTCDDAVLYFDLDRLPASHRDDFETAHAAIDEARTRNAHERCRRFASAPLTLSPEEALKHVEGRAQDLAQARPEYNHATNALCIVGRRNWNRSLFLDRRAFLTSYDPAQDDEDSSILFRILAAAIPVCAGINLEYYFSCVDYVKYGSGSKLPHNLIAMLGVMEGTASDLRTGLYQQMIEIHEPLRLLFVIETTPEAMQSIIDRHEGIGRLCRGGWVQLAVIDPETSAIQIYRNGEFQPYEPATDQIAEKASSRDCYEGSRDHLPFFAVRETPAEESLIHRDQL